MSNLNDIKAAIEILLKNIKKDPEASRLIHEIHK